jgi:hypothetical protein
MDSLAHLHAQKVTASALDAVAETLQPVEPHEKRIGVIPETLRPYWVAWEVAHAAAETFKKEHQLTCIEDCPCPTLTRALVSLTLTSADLEREFWKQLRLARGPLVIRQSHFAVREGWTLVGFDLSSTPG